MMNYSWQESQITETGVSGTIGMFGQSDSSGNDAYYFYMEFRPDNDDEWWTVATDKYFRVLF